MCVECGREVCGRLGVVESREWLCANGIGGFASGTVAGTLTRRYHGLLVAALKPPLGRTLLVAKLDETAEYDGLRAALSTNRWAGGTVAPHGYREIERSFIGMRQISQTLPVSRRDRKAHYIICQEPLHLIDLTLFLQCHGQKIHFILYKTVFDQLQYLINFIRHRNCFEFDIVYFLCHLFMASL